MHSTELQDALFILKGKKKLQVVILMKALHRQQYGGAQVDAEHFI